MTPFTPYTFGDEAPTSIYELPRKGEPVEKVAARPTGGSKSGAKCLETALQAALSSQIGGREGHEGVFQQPDNLAATCE